MSPNDPPAEPGDRPSDPRRGSGPAKPTPPPGASTAPRPVRRPVGDDGWSPAGAPYEPDGAAYGGAPAPDGDPAAPYAPADAELAALRDEHARRFTWVAVAAGAAVLVSIVALILAIGAGGQATDDDEIAEAVKRESRSAARQIERRIADETKQAGEVLDELRAGTKAAKEASAKAAEEATSSESGVAENAKQITALQKTVDDLSSKVDGLPTGVSGLDELSTTVEDLGGQVDQLVQDVATLQSGSGAATP